MNMIATDEIAKNKTASFYPLRLDFYSKKENPSGRTDLQQAEYLLQLVNFLCLKGYQKVGLAVSTNFQQTNEIKPIHGKGQANVVDLMNGLLKTEDYKHLLDKIKFLPVTTCEFGGGKGILERKWVESDLQNVNDFKKQNGNILIGWKNQTSGDGYGYGGGVAGKLREDIHQLIQEVFKRFEKEYNNESSEISIPHPLALKYCNLFRAYAPGQIGSVWHNELVNELSKCKFINEIQKVLDTSLAKFCEQYISNSAIFGNAGPQLIKLIDDLQKEATLLLEKDQSPIIMEEKNPQKEEEETSRHFQKARTMFSRTTFFGSNIILYSEENKQKCIIDCIAGLDKLNVAKKDEGFKISLIDCLTNLIGKEYSLSKIDKEIGCWLEYIDGNKEGGFSMIKNNNLKTFLKNFQNSMRKPDAEKPTEGKMAKIEK